MSTMTAYFATCNGRVTSWEFSSDNLDRRKIQMYVNRNNASFMRRGGDASMPYRVLTVEFEPRPANDADETPAAPQPRYVAVPSGVELGFIAMVHDNQRDQTVPGSSVTNMQAAVDHAARLNAFPHYYAGIEHGTMAWCVQENKAGGPRCSPRFFGEDGQQQAEALALKMNQEEGLLLPEPVAGLMAEAREDEAAPVIDEALLAEILAQMDLAKAWTSLSYQEQAAEIVKRLGSL